MDPTDKSDGGERGVDGQVGHPSRVITRQAYVMAVMAVMSYWSYWEDHTVHAPTVLVCIAYSIIRPDVCLTLRRRECEHPGSRVGLSHRPFAVGARGTSGWYGGPQYLGVPPPYLSRCPLADPSADKRWMRNQFDAAHYYIMAGP